MLTNNERKKASAEKSLSIIGNDIWDNAENIKYDHKTIPSESSIVVKKSSTQRTRTKTPDEFFQVHDLRVHVNKVEISNRTLLKANRTLRLEKSRLIKKNKKQKMLYWISVVILGGLLAAMIIL